MLRWCYVVATWIAEGCQRPNRTSQRSSSALSKQKAWFGKCRESTRTLSAAGNEKLPPANVSVQRSTMGQLKQKKQLTHSTGKFWWYAKTLRIPNEKPHHIKIPVETQYIMPFSNDLWYITKCAPRNSNGEKKNTKKDMLSWSIYDFNFDGHFFWSVIERHQVRNELHQKSQFYDGKT